MRRKDREVTDSQDILTLLNNTKILHLGLMEDEYPYIVPMHYGYEFVENKLVFYMHSAKEGKKLDLIRQNPNCFVELENDVELTVEGDIACKYGSNYSSLMAKGHVSIVEDDEQKIHALKTMMVHQTGREFEINAQMASAVSVLCVQVEAYTVKSRHIQ